MKVVYGKEQERIDLTPLVTSVNWSSSRGQIAQIADIQISDSPTLQAAGYLMLFAKEMKTREQFFHGPILKLDRDEKTHDLHATAYELSWYLQKNEVSRPYLKGDAGRELERLIKGAGINFSCPSFGFTVKERMSTQSYASLFTSLVEQAYDKTGIRYFIQHERDVLTVLAEGNNSLIPVFQINQLESASLGESIEEVYTVITVERYQDERVAGSVTKESAQLIKQIGRMQKIIDTGEEKNLSAMAAKQLAELSRIPKTRAISVRFSDSSLLRLRAGWKIKIQEKSGNLTEWIVTSCSGSGKGTEFTMELQLERRG
ncbi:XkdQ/YqbQ family protein [Brevibacillus daliensis]|uniref:XkdQ/YqbQ family protein n=1 Tax=Brevibacillus daliensis TaxID=2892995 RepID=UPI001E3B5C0C|nr:hypothetical protein [Brevibacillus daliensis]